MEKQKIKILAIVFMSLYVSIAFACNVFAAASAKVSWVAPIYDEGAGTPALTGLTGYRVYYDTVGDWVTDCTAWAADHNANPLTGNYVDVASGVTIAHFFANSLTAGATYNFSVVAYDGDDNLSNCATEDGTGNTYVSKRVLYSGDINKDGVVNGGDVTTAAGVYLSNSCGISSDVNNDCWVNGGDVTILAEDYLKPAL